MDSQAEALAQLRAAYYAVCESRPSATAHDETDSPEIKRLLDAVDLVIRETNGE